MLVLALEEKDVGGDPAGAKSFRARFQNGTPAGT
jgi:hypothetical protein